MTGLLDMVPINPDIPLNNVELLVPSINILLYKMENQQQLDGVAVTMIYVMLQNMDQLTLLVERTGIMRVIIFTKT